MKSIGFALMGFFLLSQSANAFPTWASIAFTTTPGNAPQVVAAADNFMNSDVGKEFPGLLLLQVFIANGSDPATHTFIPLYKSVAEREAYAQKVMDSAAWAEFQATMTKISQPASQVMYRTLKSWGEVVDTDPFWVSYAFTVEDQAAFAAALGKFMASETGKKFPGQVHLEFVMAGGLSEVTHAISVGYASQAEMETWSESLTGNADWAAYLEAVRPTARPRGATMGLTIKSWGSVTLGDLSVP